MDSEVTFNLTSKGNARRNECTLYFNHLIHLIFYSLLNYLISHFFKSQYREIMISMASISNGEPIIP